MSREHGCRARDSGIENLHQTGSTSEIQGFSSGKGVRNIEAPATQYMPVGLPSDEGRWIAGQDGRYYANLMAVRPEILHAIALAGGICWERRG